MDTNTPHGWTILDKAAGVLETEYRFDGVPGYANTFVVRGKDGLLVVSPGPNMVPGEYADLAAFGPVKYLLANNGLHYQGQASWREQFPEARCFAPAAAVPRLNKKCPGLKFETIPRLTELLPGNINVIEVPGTRSGEVWVAVQTGQGAIWYGGDTFANMPRRPGNFFEKLAFGLTDSAPGFKINKVALKVLTGDFDTLKQRLLRETASYPPIAMVPGHGATIHRPDLIDEVKALLAGI